MKRGLWGALFLSFLFLLPSAHAERWTILVYLAADHELSPAAIADLREMEAKLALRRVSREAPTIRILAELDSNLPSGRKRYEISQDSRPLERLALGELQALQESSLHSPVLETLSETAGETQAMRLASFLNWGLKRAPSDRLLLVLWGHGMGYGQGLLPDHSDGARLQVPELQKALEELRKRRGGRPLDLLLFDTCSMMGVETIAELARETRFIAGSPLLLPEPGLPYARLLTAIRSGNFSSSKDPIHALAGALPKIALASYQPGLGSQWKLDPQAFRDLLYVSVSAEEFARVSTPALGAWARELQRAAREIPGFLESRSAAHDAAPQYAPPGNHDLGVVLAAVPAALAGSQAPPALRLVAANAKARAALFRSLSGTAKGREISWSRGTRKWVANPAGITAWLPLPREGVAELPALRKSLWWRSLPGWGAAASLFHQNPGQE